MERAGSIPFNSAALAMDVLHVCLATSSLAVADWLWLSNELQHMLNASERTPEAPIVTAVRCAVESLEPP